MQATKVQRNGTRSHKINEEVKEVVSPAIRVAKDTEVTKQFGNHFVTDEFSTVLNETASTQPKRINPDSGIFIRVVIGGVIVAGLVAFAISFVSLYAVAEWLGLPQWMWWAVPVFIDLAILVYAGLVLVHRARGERTWPAWSALGAFTLLSVIANSAHALSHEHAAVWQSYVAVLIAAMVPIAIFVATEQLSRVAIEDLASRKSELQDQVELEIFHAEQQQKREDLDFERKQRQLERKHQLAVAQREYELEQQELERKLTVAHEDEPKAAQVPSSSKTQNSTRDAIESVTRPSTNEDMLIKFVRDRVASGDEVTGAMVAQFLGVSDRTGRRRIKDLEARCPELFEADVAREIVGKSQGPA